MLVLLRLLWGINWTVMKISLQDIPPLSMRTISSAFAALTLLGSPSFAIASGNDCAPTLSAPLYGKGPW